MPPMSHFCQMGTIWPTQASAGPCSPPCSSDPVEGNLGFCITAFQKERKLNFSQRKYLLLISVNMREIDTAPHTSFHASCLFKLTLPHQRKLRECCWLLAQYPAGLHMLPSPRPPALHDHRQVRRTKCELSHGETCMSAFPPPPPRVQRDGEVRHSPFRG